MKKSDHYLIYCLLFFFICSETLLGQRKSENLDRGVVAMPKSSSTIFISWRHFATDPDEIMYNIYYKTSESGALTKLNDTPISNSTNYTANLKTADNDYFFVVKSVLNGIEKDEPGDFKVARNTPATHVVKSIPFAPSPQGYPTKMATKYCWVGDLNGDGKYDFVVDRHGSAVVEDEESEDNSSRVYSPLVEAYSSEGELLWRVNIGPNVIISQGHSDMITCYDMDGDGKAEVLMAVSEGTTFADGQKITGSDGTVTNYNSLPGSAPQWVAVVNGETGNLIDKVPLSHFDDIATTRSDKWKHISGHFIIAHLDGINPSLIYQYKNRQPNGKFTGAFGAWSLINNRLVEQWATRFQKEESEYESHQVRAADVDEDGKDEFVEISYVMDDDGSVLYYAPNVGHGDRHVLADIDPDRPGLEHFYIQQTNIMGSGIFDAATGEIIKGHYLSAVSDVGRGSCAAFIPNKRGLQYFTATNSSLVYDAKGSLITNARGMYPSEALWWGPDLSRWMVSAGTNGVPYFDRSELDANELHRFNRVRYNGKQFYSLEGIKDHRTYSAGRPAFWGDILGDWREEMVMLRRDSTGIGIISTWDQTAKRQYCLMQNPAYRIQATAKGYYQTPDVDFYMAFDMPKPPIAPVQKADIYLTQGNQLTSATNGKSVMLDIRNPNSTITLNENINPTTLWLMNPKGKNYVIEGSGKLTGGVEVIKSMQGDVVLNGMQNYTGKTRISEGRLFINGSLASPVQIDARGVIGGNATLHAGVTLEVGLNVEGGRIEPGYGASLGNLIIEGGLTLPGRNNLAFDIDQSQPTKNDSLIIHGDFNVFSTDNSLILNALTLPRPDTLSLVYYTGSTNVTKDNFKIRGLAGVPYKLLFEKNVIKIVFLEPRQAATVEWKGTYSGEWDYLTHNFMLNGEETIFVPGDTIIFNDNAINKEIKINETLPIGGLIFTNNEDYEISGSGVISGDGKLKKTGSGKVALLTSENTFTGSVDFSDGILEVSSLKDGGQPSSIGSSSSDSFNWIMRNATLQSAGQSATDRNLFLYGKLTIINPTTNTSIMLKGNVTGENPHLELDGEGTLNLTGVNDFENIKIKNGIISLGGVLANSTALGSGTITMEGGRLNMRDNNNSSNIKTFTNPIHVPEGGNATWSLPMRWRFENKLTGSGTIRIHLPYSRADFRGDWSEFTGTINFTGADVRMVTDLAKNLSNAEVNMAAGTYLYVASSGGGQASGSHRIGIGALSGSGNLSGANHYTVGNKNINTVFDGIIGNGVGSLTKNGTGSLTLTNSNLYTGGTNINEGILILAAPNGNATGTGNVIVNDSGILSGLYNIPGIVTINEGGSLMPGLSPNSIGSLNLGSNLIMNSGSKLTIKTLNTENDTIIVGGNINMNETTLELVNLANSYNLGDSFKILSVAGDITGNFKTIIPQSPGNNLAWDLSQIQMGIISITEKITQTINFEELTEKYYGDHDFIPNATASSGLPITYSSSNTNVATIVDNMIHIVGIGTTNITASQDGDYLYNKAEPISRELRVLPLDIVLNEVRINGDVLEDLNQPFIVPKDYSDKKITVTIDAGKHTTIDKGTTFEVLVDKPSVQNIPFTISAEGVESKTYSIIVEKRFNFLDLVNVKWNNLLIVNNNKQNNGGYEFKSFKWVKDESTVGDKQYYRADETGSASFYVEVTTTDDMKLRTWDENVTLDNSQSKIKIYPNPVRLSQSINLSSINKKRVDLSFEYDI